MKPKLNTNVPERDLCWTPPYATEALCDFLAEESGGEGLSNKSVWEPAHGEYHIVDALRSRVRSLFKSDITTGFDFLLDETDFLPLVDCIITNPPYTAKTKYAFIERCVDLGKPFALLMPVETISASAAQQQFARVGGISVLHFDTRVDFKQQGTSWVDSKAQFPTAWFIHGFGLEPNRNYYTSIKEAKKAFKAEMRKVEL